jgi:hypothetical protein
MSVAEGRLFVEKIRQHKTPTRLLAGFLFSTEQKK